MNGKEVFLMKGNAVWNIFKKIIKILFAFIPIHEEIVNEDKDKNKN